MWRFVVGAIRFGDRPSNEGWRREERRSKEGSALGGEVGVGSALPVRTGHEDVGGYPVGSVDLPWSVATQLGSC